MVGRGSVVLVMCLHNKVLKAAAWKDFTEYANVCFREFGDRVTHWTTINEPNLFVLAGYDWGDLPPGRCSHPFGDCSKGNSTTEPYIAAHYILLAYASAYRLYEKNYKDKQHGFIGFNVLSFWFVPLTDSSEDVFAAKRVFESLGIWRLPDLMKNAGPRIPAFTVQESESIRSSFDFLGPNYYYGMYFKNISNTLHSENRDVIADVGTQLHCMPLLLE
ncbi:beta-glucosidase 21 [Morus notabilis]|uniref:beta-glucosidase 21 n=1 Tax=Morus notabilis TaxID=981085 RepID=UPI000CED6CEE|nr:beta-glucosidase 21 [Morus notabilis]